MWDVANIHRPGVIIINPFKNKKNETSALSIVFLAPVHVLNHQLAHTLRSTKVEFRRPELYLLQGTSVPGTQA